MNKLNIKIKLAFIIGLQKIVSREVSNFLSMRIITKEKDCLYLEFSQNYSDILLLKSVSRAYIVAENSRYNPLYVSKHKSIIGELIEIVISKNKKQFKSFKITCAGSDSPEVQSIAKYIREEYALIEKEEADLKIYIIKPNDTWEIGIQITSSPLSFRNYKAINMAGAMHSTVAYAMNSLCELENKESYLNAFSGSATLLIEAGLSFPNLKKLIGFDNTKKHISLAIQNIKKAGLIKRIEIYEKDIFDKPNFGKFDVITADLPFGMAISKNENLEKLYLCFIEYCEKNINTNGVLAMYTSEHELLERLLLKSRFAITKTMHLKFITSANAYLRPKIFVCKLK